MGENPRPLASLDPLQVPLPHGTEVTLRVERTVAGRRIPQGSVGRVHKTLEGGEVEVTVVGVGNAVYKRDELVPRKEGQAQFARRRAGDWEALLPCRVIETTVGSRAWGLAHEGSDTDLRGVFVLPFPWTLGLLEPPADLVSIDGSATYWEVGKAVRQGLRADPNTLETLFVASARPLDEMGAWLLEARDAFASAAIFGSFGQYALAQLRRLLQAARLAEHRALVLEWLRADPVPGLDEVAGRLARSSGLDKTRSDADHQAREYVKHLYRSLYDQGLLAQRDYAGLVAFARTEAAQFDLPRELRPKNAYNLIRLIATATDWLKTGRAEFEVRGALRERLLAIKGGQVPLAEVLAEAEGMTPALEAAFRATALPPRPDVARAHAALVRIGQEAARRWAGQAPGPWGVNAPPPPEAAWSES